jgi:hypothetical protein
MYKLISCDLDGTLKDKNGDISPKDIEAIHKWVDSGRYFVINSGRAPASILFSETKIGLIDRDGYGIGFNGGAVYRTDTRELLTHETMPNETGQKVLSMLKTLGANVIAYIGNTLYTEKVTDFLLPYITISGVEYVEIGDFSKLTGDISKILAIGEMPELIDIQNKTNPHIAGLCDSVFTASVLLEFVPLGVNKGKGLRKLAEMLDIDMSEVIAIGDNQNDLPMIECAGLGIAVGNALDEVKEKADLVMDLTNNESVVSGIILKYM